MARQRARGVRKICSRGSLWRFETLEFPNEKNTDPVVGNDNTATSTDPSGNVGVIPGPEPYLDERVGPLQGIPKNLQLIVVSEKSVGDEPASAVIIETRSVTDRIL